MVIDAKEVTGSIYIPAGVHDVTIKRTRVLCKNTSWCINPRDGARNILIQDVEVVGDGVTNGQVAVGWDGIHAVRVNIHGTEDGFRLAYNNTVEDSWVHDLANPLGSSHNDCVQSTGGDNNVLRHNSLIRTKDQTSAILLKTDQAGINNWVIDNNLLDGGSYTFYMRGTPAGTYGLPTNMSVTNNHFRRNYLYGYQSIDTGVQFTQSGNVWDDNNAPINLKYGNA
jgi:hypothetical protein